MRSRSLPLIYPPPLRRFKRWHCVRFYLIRLRACLKRETTIFCEKQTLKKKGFGNLIKYQESALIPTLMIKRELINF